MREYHELQPIYNRESRILILGSFPSVKSREGMFYYHHPSNRFWRVMAAVCGADTPVSISEKKAFLLEHQIALWDVIASCEIAGSSDSSIRDVEVNDLPALTACGKIEHIYTNGATADNLYHRYFDDKIFLPVTRLPSTSPANAAYSLERLTVCWRKALAQGPLGSA